MNNDITGTISHACKLRDRIRRTVHEVFAADDIPETTKLRLLKKLWIAEDSAFIAVCRCPKWQRRWEKDPPPD